MALIHLDAGVLIGFLDDRDAHHEGARRAIAAAVDERDRLAMAASALAECLVGPWRSGRVAVELVLDLCRQLPLDVVPIDEDVASEAARLRAQHGSIRLPDALVVATAVAAGARRLVTTDRRWPATVVDGSSLELDIL